MAQSAPPNKRAQKPPIKPNLPYCCSFNLLLLKFLEVACTLASLILALQYEAAAEIIIIEILSALALVTALSWMILYCINVNARFPEFFSKLIFVYHLVMCILCVICVICAAILWPQFKVPIYVACTFTSLIAAICFLLDALHDLMVMRGTQEEIMTCPCSPWEPELTI